MAQKRLPMAITGAGLGIIRLGTKAPERQQLGIEHPPAEEQEAKRIFSRTPLFMTTARFLHALLMFSPRNAARRPISLVGRTMMSSRQPSTAVSRPANAIPFRDRAEPTPTTGRRNNWKDWKHFIVKQCSNKHKILTGRICALFR